MNTNGMPLNPCAKYIAEHTPQPGDVIVTRRDFLQRTGMGMGALTLGTMLSDLLGPNAVAASPLAPRLPHFAAKAKHVIHIFASGGPSHVDTFDPKPMLEKFADKEI